MTAPARWLILAGLLAIVFITGMIEPCEDGHKCPTPTTIDR